MYDFIMHHCTLVLKYVRTVTTWNQMFIDTQLKFSLINGIISIVTILLKSMAKTTTIF